MSSMLYSLKFVRKLSFATRLRGLSVHRIGWPVTTGTNLQPGYCACSSPFHQREFDRNYITRVAAKHEPIRARANADFIFKDVDRQLNKYGKIYREQIDELLQAVYSAGTLSTSQALFLLRCCGQFLTIDSLKNRRAITETVWEVIKDYGTQTDISHYNALILAHLENETDFSPVNILLEMKEKNIEPNRVTFQRLIEQYCCKGDMAGATKILEHMSELGLPLNETIFNSLIKGHSECGDLQSAVKILDIMEKAGIQPGSKSYTAILCAHAKRGDAKSMQETLKECQLKDFLLSDGEIFEIIYTLGINNHPHLVDEMLNILPKGRSYVKEATTCIHKLMDKSLEPIAYKIHILLDDSVDSKQNQAYYFIRKLVLTSQDVKKIAKYCNILGKEDPCKLFSAAVHIAFTNNLHSLALPLFNHWKKSGGEIREHYFFPIFVSCIRNNDLQGILSTLKAMISQYKITPQHTVLKQYVVPYMVEDPDRNVKTLLKHGVNNRASLTAVACQLLIEGKQRAAHTLIASRNMICNPSILTSALGDCLETRKDVESFVNIVHHQFSLLSRDEPSITKELLTEDDGRMGPLQFSGTALLKALDKLSTDSEDSVYEILSKFVSRGLSVDPEIAVRIKMKLKDRGFNSTFLDLVSKLTLDLPSMPYSDQTMKENVTKFSRQASNDQNRSDDSNSIEYKMSLIAHNARSQNADTVEQLLKELEERNPVYNDGFCCTLIHYYCRFQNLEQAEKWYKLLNDIDPQCRVGKSIILNYARLLISHDRFDDALQVLNRPILDKDLDLYKLCAKLLWGVERIHPERVEEFFKILESRQFFKTFDKDLIAPLVKGPLEAGDINQALERFKWSCENFKYAPHLGTVLSKLIEMEDTKNLQFVTDLSTKVLGETGTLLNLAVAFIETNKIRQAKRILQSTGAKFNIQQIMSYARYFKKQAKLDCLERLYQASLGLLPDMDYFHRLMLDTYEEQGDWKKCLALWTQLQEENIQPSPRFMAHLEKILLGAHQELPFARTEENDESEESSVEITGKNLTELEVSELKSRLAGLPFIARSQSYVQLIDYYLEHRELQSASSYIHEMIAIQQYDLKIQFYLQRIVDKLAEMGEFETIKKAIAEMMKPENKVPLHVLHKLKFIINKRYLDTRKYGEYLLNLESSMLNAVNPDNTILVYLFDTRVGVKALMDHPELEEYLEEFALKASKVRLFAPINCVWLYNFLKERPKANEFWEKILKRGIHVHCMDIIKACKLVGALDKMPVIAEVISTSNMNDDLRIKSFEYMLRILTIWDEPMRYHIAYECLKHISKSNNIQALDSNLIANIEENLTIDR